VESYQTMSKACYNCAQGNVTDCLRHHCVTANGFSRNIKTVNRGIPGPTIQVKKKETKKRKKEKTERKKERKKERKRERKN
jgi:hypothetical protein